MIGKRVTEIEQRLHEVMKKLAAISADIDGIHEHLKGVDAHIIGTDACTETLARQHKELKSQLNRVLARFDYAVNDETE